VLGYDPARDELAIKYLSGVVPQDNNLDDELNVLQNLMIYSKFYGLSAKVARERIAALPGNKDYGAFSCFVQYYAFPEILFLIKKGSFYPVPKVDSCFLRLDIRKDPAVKVNDEQLFFQIIRTGFNQRRKTLKNSLKTLVPVRTLEEFFLRYQINPQIRAEDLNLQGFANLTNLCK